MVKETFPNKGIPTKEYLDIDIIGSSYRGSDLLIHHRYLVLYQDDSIGILWSTDVRKSDSYEKTIEGPLVEECPI